jgi:hypothetical protein
MEDTVHGSVESGDRVECGGSGYFLEIIGNCECFQTVTDQVLQYGVDDSVFFVLSLNELQSVCGHACVYDRMSEYKHNSTRPCNVPVVLFDSSYR